MKVLCNECVPVPLANLLPGHECILPVKAGLDGLSNGKVLAGGAATGFECLLTVDRNMMRQQDLSELPMPVILMAVLGQHLQRRVYEVPESDPVLA